MGKVSVVFLKNGYRTELNEEIALRMEKKGEVKIERKVKEEEDKKKK